MFHMTRAEIDPAEIAAYTDGVLRARRAYYSDPTPGLCIDCDERPRYRNQSRCNPCKNRRHQMRKNAA